MNSFQHLIVLIIFAIMRDNGTSADCGGRLSSSEIRLTSPNYPEEYPGKQDCIWIIDFPKGKTIMVGFEAFNLEYQYDCENDFLELRDGSNESSPMIGNKLCGWLQDYPSIFSSSNELFIRFHSNDKQSLGMYSGFRILLTSSPNCSMDVDCSEDYYCKFTNNRSNLVFEEKTRNVAPTGRSGNCARKYPCDQKPMVTRDYICGDLQYGQYGREYASYVRKDSGCQLWRDDSGCGRNDNQYNSLYECNKACGCSADQFTCGDGNCVPNDSKCDGKEDCTDKSDETFCGVNSVCTLVAGTVANYDSWTLTLKPIGHTKNELECFSRVLNRELLAVASTWHRYSEKCVALHNDMLGENKMPFEPVINLNQDAKSCILILNETCKTIGGLSEISVCRFPFQYKNKRNTKCIWSDDGPWCSTLDKDGWAFCGEDCPIEMDQWSDWGEWSLCSKGCDDGIQTSLRSRRTAQRKLSVVEHDMSYDKSMWQVHGLDYDDQKRTKVCHEVACDNMMMTLQIGLWISLALWIFVTSIIAVCLICIRTKGSDKITKRYLITTFTGICFLLTAYMTVTQVLRYLENNDTSRVGYKMFNDSPKDTYPDFTLCFTSSILDDFMESKSGLVFSYFGTDDNYMNSFDNGKLGITRHDYGQLLKGKIVSAISGWQTADMGISNISDIDVKRLTIQPDDIASTIEFWAKNPNNSIYWSKPGDYASAAGRIVARIPLQLSYQDSETICFTRKYVKKLRTLRLEDSIYLLQQELKRFDEYVMMKVYIHQPGQLIRSFDKPAYETILCDFEWERNLISLALSQVSVLRRRKDANSPCDPDLYDEDSFIRKKIIAKVGCIPIYWKFLLDVPVDVKNCDSGRELESVYYHTQNFGDIVSNHYPPCNDMQISVNVDQKRRSGYWLLAIQLIYKDSKYQEIVNEREFSFETFWSSVGGFVGIFMGYSLLQIPDLVEMVWIWVKNLYGSYKTAKSD